MRKDDRVGSHALQAAPGVTAWAAQVGAPSHCDPTLHARLFSANDDSHALQGAPGVTAWAAQVGAPSRCDPMPHARQLPATVPLSEGRYKVQFSAGQRLHDKLRQAQELMRHRAPNGDLAVVLERAVDLLIAERKKQLFGKAAKPRRSSSSKPARTSRYVPRAIRREVAQRAEEQCSFVAPDGHRCTSRARLELDHRVPYARGGSTSAANMRLLCRTHNRMMAERAYGRAFMSERIDSARQARADRRCSSTDSSHLGSAEPSPT